MEGCKLMSKFEMCCLLDGRVEGCKLMSKFEMYCLLDRESMSKFEMCLKCVVCWTEEWRAVN